ncbi:hypothetical protein KSF_089010 [Reticulibacter mediterranei]|uniref:Uncharacterized protein n=1 Tax=Reticulibacter mediterranei TaxID=2778369 RepID=A0A8J3IRB5_9CHLR|nr:hypothetical protein KSF_089010 [Reticulibacter mediterranei]
MCQMQDLSDQGLLQDQRYIVSFALEWKEAAISRSRKNRGKTVVLQEMERKQDEQKMAPLVPFRQSLQTAG